MRSIVRMLAFVMLVSANLWAAELVNVSGADRVALGGYDPVAFFTDAKPVSGSASIAANFGGATYYFATEAHKHMFEQNPANYAPQYGGFCAYGVSRGGLVPVEISTWQVRNGKLYLNKNSDVLKLFNADFDGNVSKAEMQWPGLVAKKGR